MGNRDHNKMDQQTVTWTVQTASTWDHINGERLQMDAREHRTQDRNRSTHNSSTKSDTGHQVPQSKNTPHDKWSKRQVVSGESRIIFLPERSSICQYPPKILAINI